MGKPKTAPPENVSASLDWLDELPAAHSKHSGVVRRRIETLEEEFSELKEALETETKRNADYVKGLKESQIKELAEWKAKWEKNEEKLRKIQQQLS